jgi:hypothetical protein
MDAAPTPWQSESLVLEINRDSDGRLEGRLRSPITDAWRPFSGVLELLKALEEALDIIESAVHAPTTEGTAS